MRPWFDDSENAEVTSYSLVLIRAEKHNRETQVKAPLLSSGNAVLSSDHWRKLRQILCGVPGCKCELSVPGANIRKGFSGNERFLHPLFRWCVDWSSGYSQQGTSFSVGEALIYARNAFKQGGEATDDYPSLVTVIALQPTPEDSDGDVPESREVYRAEIPKPSKRLAAQIPMLYPFETPSTQVRQSNLDDTKPMRRKPAH